MLKVFHTKQVVIGKNFNQPLIKICYKFLQDLHWISELKLNCFARTFVYGLDTGRNCTKKLEEFLTAEEIIGIKKKIAIIQLEDKEPVEDDVED